MSMDKQCKDTSILIVEHLPDTPPNRGGSGDYTQLIALHENKANNNSVGAVVTTTEHPTSLTPEVGTVVGVNNRTPIPSCRKFTIRSSRSSSRTHQRRMLADKIQQIITSSTITPPNTPTNKCNNNSNTKNYYNTDTGKLFVRKSRNRHKSRRSLSFDGSTRMDNRESSLHNDRSNILTKEIVIRNDMGRNTNSNNGNDNCNSDIDNDTAAANLHMKQASRRVGFMLMLNAWRHCRAQLCDMIQHSVKLESQIDQQRLQIAVLRELINTDNLRVSTANEEAKKAQEAVLVAEQLVNQTQEENEELKKNISTMEDKIIEYTTEIKNEKNNILMVRSQVNALENQLTKDREKLSRLRDDKMHLVHKVQQIEEKLQQKEIDLETIKAVHLQLEERFDEQRMINAACMDEIDTLNEALKEMQLNRENLEEKCKALEKKLEMRQSELTNVQTELQIAREDVHNLAEHNDQLSRSLHDTQSRLHLQCHRPWWSLAAELATGPISALHTAARIALPALPQNHQTRLMDSDSNKTNIFSMNEYILKVTTPDNSSDDVGSSCCYSDSESSRTISNNENSYTTIQEL
ncbi:SUN domain-containing protein 2-like [Chrysoperla carnea]|uniref:SUN domain-containing protein 2-like n=1 Tax=Chrysoperla carnea TaxID=189513 RepID=UPI001D090C90|nr:SUN domain-containing protein 2-like [Chrysoperla carnea]